jgi:sortase A
LLITVGAVLLLFVAYELWWTGLYTHHQQSVLLGNLQNSWRHPPNAMKFTALGLPAVPIPGDGIAVLRIPRFGPHYQEVIVQGVQYADLEKGPGHYPGTAMPGQIGNFVVSGHRTTWSAPFNQLATLRRGDKIEIETRNYWFIYRVTRLEIVLPNDLAVIAPVPDHPGRTPHQAMLTFTTCNPEYSAAQRLVAHGLLWQRLPRLPSATSGGG